MLPSRSSSQPGDEPGTHSPPIWPCSRWGLAAAASPQSAGRSYRPISPLSRQSRGGMFLCHFPSPMSTAKRPRDPGSYPAPCPEEPGLSSPPIYRSGGHPAYLALQSHSSIGDKSGSRIVDPGAITVLAVIGERGEYEESLRIIGKAGILEYGPCRNGGSENL